jgi:hypothetical protein
MTPKQEPHWCGMPECLAGEKCGLVPGVPADPDLVEQLVEDTIPMWGEI